MQLLALGMLAAAQAANPAAADLIVSANDGKFVRVEGRATFPRPAPPDSLAVIDASRSPPAIVALVEGVEHSVQGPPQAVAITPDGALAIVAAPSRWDEAAGREMTGEFLQVVDLAARPARLLGRVALGAHPNGVAVSPRGDLLLAAALDGKVHAFRLRDRTLQPLAEVPLSTRRLGSVTFTHDGRAALVTLRDDGGVAVLAVDGDRVTDTGERVSTGLAPYCVDVSADGRWAVVSHAGLNGLPTLAGRISAADADSVALIDVARRPFRTVQYLTVPSTAECAAISPDGRWIAVRSLAGSNLPPTNSQRQPRGALTLFEIANGVARQVDEVHAGVAGQGLVFARDSRTFLVQQNVERAIAIYMVRNGRLRDTGQRMPLAAGPSSMRSKPR